jgi:hypothetical protein
MKIPVLISTLLLLAPMLFGKEPQIVTDAKKSAEWIANALNSSGYKADFSVESLKEIERFFNEHSQDGKPKPGGLLSEQLGNRIFSLGSYVGEVIIRQYGGEWIGDDKDPQAEMNIEVKLKGKVSLYPIQKTMKRLRNGKEDNLHHYVLVAGEILKNEEAQQGGAGQPATRSESDLEGGDKPQPESERRSR